MCYRAGDGTRTRDVQLGKLAFYQLNYARTLLTSTSPKLSVGLVGGKRFAPERPPAVVEHPEIVLAGLLVACEHTEAVSPRRFLG